MDKDKIIKKLKKIIIFVVLILIIWFLLLNPLIRFKMNESKMLEASKRYFEVNSNELPTGDRTKTIYLKDLYSKAFLKEDFYVPLTKKACSVTESWTKVRRVNGEYKYYTYLKCGVLSSIIDHKGPEITLNGDDEITIDKDNKYTELGVKSVKDNKDGKIDVSKVKIDNTKVNTSKEGSYDITYTVFDSLNNKTVKVRKVKVVSKLKNIVKKATNNLGYYKGTEPDNYIYFSNMLFRIVGISNGNVKIIADQDIANINYDGIEKWLDNYYYNHLSDNSKKYIVEDKYCNMNIDDSKINTTECASYTEKRKSYIISIDDINKSLENGNSYLKSDTVSWISNKYDNNESYTTKYSYYGADVYGKTAVKFSKDFNYGIRPVITIKGDSLIKDGDGTYENPYSIGETKPAKADDYLNTRNTGEYIEYSGYLWRIVDIDSDNTTKIICDDTLKVDGEEVSISYDTKDKAKIYSSSQKGNIGYFIKNKISEYLKLNYFVNKNVMVPIYKDKILYGEEVENKKTKTKLSAPNMYEIFSAHSFINDSMGDYWFINSSKKQDIKAVIADVGVVINEEIDDNDQFGIRPVGYLDKNVKIASGKGTIQNPYKVIK